jgi:hypothetical protein
MASFELEVQGLDELAAELDRLEEQWTDGLPWLVGTAVEYSIYLEFGTSDMNPKPFVRPALLVYRANLEAAIATDTQTTLEEIGSADELVRTTAFGLERRIKRIITQKGLIETGTLRASVKAIPGTDTGALLDADDADPTASADVEVSA